MFNEDADGRTPGLVSLEESSTTDHHVTETTDSYQVRVPRSSHNSITKLVYQISWSSKAKVNREVTPCIFMKHNALGKQFSKHYNLIALTTCGSLED